MWVSVRVSADADGPAGAETGLLRENIIDKTTEYDVQ